MVDVGVAIQKIAHIGDVIAKGSNVLEDHWRALWQDPVDQKVPLICRNEIGTHTGPAHMVDVVDHCEGCMRRRKYAHSVQHGRLDSKLDLVR